MTYETLANRNATGFDTIFVYANDITNGVLGNMILFGAFLIVLLGTYFSALRTGQKGDFPSSFAIAGYFTFILSALMLLVDGLINPFVVMVTFGVAVLGTLWLYFSRAGN